MRGRIRNRQSVVGSEASIGGCSGVRSACASRVRRGFGGTRSKAKRGEANAPITRAALIVTLLALASCGFEPLHSQSFKQSLSVDLSSITVTASGSTISNSTTTSVIPRRYAELLTAEIEDQVNPSGTRTEKLFRLAIAYTELDAPQFVKPDGTASRGDLIYDSTYTLTRIADAKPVASGSLRRVSTYNTSPNADYASYVSIEDARQRGVIGLAQDYKLRLATLLPTLNNPNAAASKSAAPAEPVPALQPIRSYETFRSGY